MSTSNPDAEKNEIPNVLFPWNDESKLALEKGGEKLKVCPFIVQPNLGLKPLISLPRSQMQLLPTLSKQSWLLIDHLDLHQLHLSQLLHLCLVSASGWKLKVQRSEQKV